jgi:prephenate dehydratase/chorismate mutase/prephenate dehydratase
MAVDQHAVHDTAQKTLVAFQGERGAYSEQALLTYFPNAEPIPCRTLADAFDAVAGGRARFAAIPIENSQAGSINDAYDLLLKHDLHIVGEIMFRVSHCLMALPGQTLADIKRVYSHPQALAQSMEYLQTLGTEIIAAYDTAGSAKTIAEERTPGAAAVASRLAATLYGLEVLAEAIETNPHNYTRFFVISPEPASPPADVPCKTSIVLTTPNSPGALYRCLGCIAWRGINLTKLESRPSRGKPWEYVFYVDFEGAADREPYRSALEELRSQTEFLRVLGSYPKASLDL